jgi:hypothetical protein
MDAALRAGAAVFNAGRYHAAHDAWEERWLDLESGTDDERLLHGLIQLGALVHHGYRGNWSGAEGLAESAGEYLGGLPADYRGVDLASVRPYLAAVAADPETVERRPVPHLRVGGEAPRLDRLDFEAAAVAAVVLAEAIEGYDADVVARAVEYAREERADETGTATRFITLVMDFAGDRRQRALVYQRLRQHVERRRQRETDVAGLFD